VITRAEPEGHLIRALDEARAKVRQLIVRQLAASTAFEKALAAELEIIWRRGL
jgi:hypothetical protein